MGVGIWSQKQQIWNNRGTTSPSGLGIWDAIYFTVFEWFFIRSWDVRIILTFESSWCHPQQTMSSGEDASHRKKAPGPTTSWCFSRACDRSGAQTGGLASTFGEEMPGNPDLSRRFQFGGCQICSFHLFLEDCWLLFSRDGWLNQQVITKRWLIFCLQIVREFFFRVLVAKKSSTSTCAKHRASPPWDKPLPGAHATPGPVPRRLNYQKGWKTAGSTFFAMDIAWFIVTMYSVCVNVSIWICLKKCSVCMNCVRNFVTSGGLKNMFLCPYWKGKFPLWTVSCNGLKPPPGTTFVFFLNKAMILDITCRRPVMWKIGHL